MINNPWLAKFRIENPIRIMRFPFRMTDRKALKGCLHLHEKPIRFELSREEPGTGEKSTKFTG
jgi:hypothetical protein